MKFFGKQLFHYLGVAVIALALASCGKEPQPGGDNTGGNGGEQVGPTETTVINGTEIKEGNNLVGLITDAATGKGIQGVPVTDGYSFTKTDANGVYQFKANRYCRKVYYTTPSGYEINLNPTTHLPEFFSTTKIDRYNISRNDFKLTPLAQPEDKFTLLMIGDPQCETQKQVDRYKNETINDITSTVNAGRSEGYVEQGVYAVTLGDVTFDNPVLWSNMKESMSNVKLKSGDYLPFFNCIGNHDHDASTSSDFSATENFFNNFGPTDYSFNRGKAHIVVMDDVVCTNTSGDSWSYEAGFSQQQFNWLKADLNNVEDKAETLVILCAHIPFRGGGSSGGSTFNKDKYYAETLQLLTEFKEAHIMIGHTHYSQNYIHSKYVCKGGNPIYEHIHGAACGSWWASNSDVIGGPNGYNVYTVEGNTISDWFNKGTNRLKSFQLRVYDGNHEYTGSKKYTYTWYTGGTGGTKNIKAKGNAVYKGAFVAQVWDDDDRNWTVELYQNGTKVGNFTRVANGGSTNVHYSAYTFNELNKNTTTWTSTTASHYWYFKPASGDPSSEQNWEVRATQKIPGSGKTNVYSCTTITNDFSSY